MSKLNKELIQSSLFTYFNKFSERTSFILLPLRPKCNFFFPRKYSFILLLLINPIPFWMQKCFKRAFVSAMDFSIIFLYFLIIIKENVRLLTAHLLTPFSRFSSHCSTTSHYSSDRWFQHE